MTVYTQNKKAKFEYEWLETYETGIVLNGGEVKSIRANKISLNESYVYIKNGELWLTNCYIAVPSYVPQYMRYDEKQNRKLLMHKKEIIRLQSKISEKGLTLVVTKIYQPENSKKIKCQLALVRGKHTYDKKNVIKERDIKRELDRSLKNYS